MEGPTAAGWYPDPQQPSQERFWFGTEWSGQTRPGTPMSRAVTPAASAPRRPQRLASERVVISAPMSFAGSARRLWMPVHGKPVAVAILFWPFLVIAVLAVWTIVLCWYVVFGLWVVPWRLFRRGSRRQKAARLRHRETLDAIQRRQR